MLVAANIFQPLIDVFEAVLKFFHNSIGVPWGWSIVLLTVVIRALLVPALVSLFGRWNWWMPSWSARLLRVAPSEAS